MSQTTSQTQLADLEDPFEPIGQQPTEIIDDRDPIFEAFGDYDAFGPFTSRESSLVGWRR